LSYRRFGAFYAVRLQLATRSAEPPAEPALLLPFIGITGRTAISGFADVVAGLASSSGDGGFD
jgi:hypothetical protein